MFFFFIFFFFKIILGFCVISGLSAMYFLPMGKTVLALPRNRIDIVI